MAKKEKQAKVSYTYDRLWEQKLSQVYYLLVPVSHTITSTEYSNNAITEQDTVYENSSYIYESIVRSAEGQ